MTDPLTKDIAKTIRRWIRTKRSSELPRM